MFRDIKFKKIGDTLFLLGFIGFIAFISGSSFEILKSGDSRDLSNLFFFSIMYLSYLIMFR